MEMQNLGKKTEVMKVNDQLDNSREDEGNNETRMQQRKQGDNGLQKTYNKR